MVGFRVLSYEKWDVYRRRPTPTFRPAASAFLRAAVRFDKYRAGVGRESRCHSGVLQPVHFKAVVYP